MGILYVHYLDKNIYFSVLHHRLKTKYITQCFSQSYFIEITQCEGAGASVKLNSKSVQLNIFKNNIFPLHVCFWKLNISTSIDSFSVFVIFMLEINKMYLYWLGKKITWEIQGGGGILLSQIARECVSQYLLKKYISIECIFLECKHCYKG